MHTVAPARYCVACQRAYLDSMDPFKSSVNMRLFGGLRLVVLCAIAFCTAAGCGSVDETPTASGDAVPTPENPATATTNYPGGALREQYQYFLQDDESIWHGAYSAFYEDGAVEVTGFYAHGQRDSTWAFFDATGRKTLQHTWNRGRRWSGPFILYWPNGQISEYGFYREGLWHGAYTSYFQSGQVEIRTQYLDDQLHGTYIEFYETGTRKLVGSYDNGFKSGLWTHYDEAGIVTLRERYESGQLQQVEQTRVETYEDGTIKSTAPLTDGDIDGVYSEYWPNGARKEETVYVRGIRHGESVIYWDNGVVRETGINSNGRKQGVWQTFTRTGELSIRASYAQGLLSGSYTSYYPSGQIQWEGTYSRNLKNGTWTNYSSSGQKRLVQFWVANRLTSGIDCRADAEACE